MSHTKANVKKFLHFLSGNIELEGLRAWELAGQTRRIVQYKSLSVQLVLRKSLNKSHINDQPGRRLRQRSDELLDDHLMHRPSHPAVSAKSNRP